MSTHAYESVTVTDTAGGLTSATYTTAISALITVETANVRYRADGTNPTSSEGHLLRVGDILELESPDEIQRIRFIRTSGTSSVIKVTYSK